jgi:hypothetical protein
VKFDISVFSKICVEKPGFIKICREEWVHEDLSTFIIVKGKAIPLQAWRGSVGSRRLRLPDFKTVGTRRW